MTLAWSLLALAASVAMLVLLGVADPKRRRIRGIGAHPVAAWRGVLTAAVLLPGVALIVAGQWAALLIWTGGMTVAGWAIASALAPARN